MKVAVIQFGAGPNKEQNINKSLRLIKKAAASGAQFILLPEVFVYRGKLTLKEAKNIAETMNGPTVKIFSALAKTTMTMRMNSPTVVSIPVPPRALCPNIRSYSPRCPNR